MSSSISQLEPWLQPWARWLISAWPYGTITSTRRSRQEQTQLYNAFLRGEAHYPAKPPGQSYHEYGRAFDYVTPDHIAAQLGALWKSVGGRWGPSDPIHFEA